MTVVLVLRNASATGCDLRGYPGVALLDAGGGSLGFRYRRHGDQMLTGSPPALVPLPPGAAAYTGVNKNDCVAGTSNVARYVRITPPGDRRSLILALPAYPAFNYCGPSDPGHTVDVAPVEAALAALYAQRA